MPTSNDLWAREFNVGGNRVCQLLVPAGTLTTSEGEAGLCVSNEYGQWPAVRSVEAPSDGPLTARLTMPGDDQSHVIWDGRRDLVAPAQVLASYRQAIGFREPSEDRSLRRPQIGALHSVLGYWASGLHDPGIVVMPTGTGKTETMLALLVAARPQCVLVIVPSIALRDQIGEKFARLGILQKERIVEAKAIRPCVGRLEHGILTADDANALVTSCNVIVATPQALDKCSAAARDVVIGGCTHLMIDEAHHSAAATWNRIIDEFAGRPTLLFTATPFREDGRSLPGRAIFRFPLREAQRDGYFTRIDYQAVLTLTETDETLADLAIARLRADRDAGLDHILMARAAGITRAESLLQLYQSRAPELNPTVIHYNLSNAARTAAYRALQDRTCRAIVCVDMLGEGFDLPALKVAALHDVKKSLGPMIQLIGRFTRSGDPQIGTASVFVARDPSVALAPLRELLREDADWNLLLNDITNRESATAEQVSKFEASFSDVPDDIPVTLLEPKLSVTVHRAPQNDWEPERAADIYADAIVDEHVSVGADGTVAWFVIEHRTDVAWGDLPNLEQTTYELIIMYFDGSRRLLYIYGSDKRGNYSDLAQSVLGADSMPINGPTTYRVLGHLDRLVPTNVGLLDVRDHFSRFTMHVGSDVNEAFESADKQTKSQTHIATSGFDNGEKVTISAALSGRIWSPRTANSLRDWTLWCDEQGAKLLDSTIDIKNLLSNLIIPVDLTERPPHVLLALEWPWELYLNTSSGPAVTFDGVTYPLIDIGFEVDDFTTTGPFKFSMVTADWRLNYLASFEPDGLTYQPIGEDAHVVIRNTSVALHAWINRHKPSLFLTGDRMITDDDRLLEPRVELAPFDPARLITLPWTGVNLRVESQGAARRPDSIQAYMSGHLQTHRSYDVLIDDDRAGEAADLVGLRVVGGELHVDLIHCKFSSKSTPGARLKDLYEVCGQAMRGAKWRQHGGLPLLTHLHRRVQDFARRTGADPFEVGDINTLYRIRERAPQLRPRFHTVIAQPGLLPADCTNEHLTLIAGAESYVYALTKGTFTLYTS